MAARMTVFCRRSVEHVTPDTMLEALKRADLACIAEDYAFLFLLDSLWKIIILMYASKVLGSRQALVWD